MEKQLDLIRNTDWKYLLVLDACRYDMFEELNNIPGDLQVVRSPASRTNKWADAADVLKPIWLKTIAVLSSQYMAHEYKNYKYVHNALLKNWNEELMTIMPRDINTEVLKLIPKHPDDRFLIWYMQPHVPFIGRTKVTWKELNIKKDGFIGFERIWKRYGKPRWLVKKGYYDNLTYVLEAVKELLPHLDGKVIITSDHGNGLGEEGIWGHETNEDYPFLREVPWLEIKE